MERMNLKVRLDYGEEFKSKGNQAVVFRKIVDGINSGKIKLPVMVDSVKTQIVCFQLKLEDLEELREISDKHKLSMAEVLREGMKQLKLITRTK